MLPAVVVALMALPTGSAASLAHGTSVAHSGISTIAPAPLGAPAGAGSTPSHAAAHPAVTAFNPPCYAVDKGVCVSIQNPGETDIIPTGSNRTANVMPQPTESLPLVIKSHLPLNYTGNPTNGSKSPIALNVTGILWNGDPYYSPYDGSTWHANSRNLWWTLLGQTNNKTYPWWYSVNISAKGANGQANFFSGEQVTWWIELTYNTNNLSYTHHEGPHLTFTYSGAWPYSPYPGSPHFGGPAATFLDVDISTVPRTPNWNDSVRVTLNTTQADVAPYNASIGAATIDLVEVSHGIVVQNTSESFNVTASAGFGNISTTRVIPAGFAQIEGAIINYRIWISDAATPADQVVTPWANYTVDGNGSFSTGSFSSDVTATMVPNSLLIQPFGEANLTPGEPLTVTIQSRNPTTSILAAELDYSVAYPLLKETIANVVQLHRNSSTIWTGTIPGLPVQSIVNFTILTWDFTDAVEQSDLYSYTVESFDQFVGPIPSDLAFFYVYVYDNGSNNWVQGAKVQITGPNGIFNSVSNTTLGVSYANQSGQPFTPLLVQANATYNVTVTDPYFSPPGTESVSGAAVSVDVVALNPMTARQPLAATPHYIVLQQGDKILFYLNGTAPLQPASPSVSESGPFGFLGVAAVIGLLLAAVAVWPVRSWWKEIKARRTAEEKRVTL
jgi:hypothetical protein